MSLGYPLWFQKVKPGLVSLLYLLYADLDIEISSSLKSPKSLLRFLISIIVPRKMKIKKKIIYFQLSIVQDIHHFS